MGQYRIEIEAMGGHGCQREVEDGGIVQGCGQTRCPDCNTRRFVQELQKDGQQVSKAIFTHWPGEPNEVVDNLLTKTREGSFQ